MIKLNLGSNNKRIGDDWLNVDAIQLPNVDLVCDITKTPFEFFKYEKEIDLCFAKTEGYRSGIFKDDYVDEIQMVEVLEHLPFRKTLSTLKEIHRILKPGGKLHIQVPDCGKAMEYYVNNEICTCVPHKSVNWEFKANPKCINCGGKAKINPLRWQYSFTGAQKHEYDSHLMIFTKDILSEVLERAGFSNFKFSDDIYKLKCNIIK